MVFIIKLESTDCFSKEGSYYLAPLKMFEKTNDALNYLDKL